MTQGALFIGMIVGGYLLLYGLEFLWNLIVRAPVALDKERAAQIAELDRMKREGEGQIEALLLENAGLKKPRKSVAEHIRFEQARVEFEKFEAHEQKFLMPLLMHEEVRYHDLKAQLMNSGFSEAQWSAVVRKAQDGSLVVRLEPSPVRSYNAFAVNPIFRDALLEVLHAAK